MKAFSKDVKIVPILAPVAAAAADRTSDVIDTKGYHAFCIVAQMGAIAAGALTSAKLQHSDTATNETTLSSGADVAGTSQTIADDDDNQAFVWDVIKPTKRYYQLAVDKDATNTTIESAVCYLYRSASDRPAAHGDGGSDVGDGIGSVNVEVYVSPASGTA